MSDETQQPGQPGSENIQPQPTQAVNVPGKEPILTAPNPAGQGRPVISEEQYKLWLAELRPYLELSNSLYRACQKAGLEDRYDSCILEKYRKKDWFSRKVDAYRSKPGENANEIYTMAMESIKEKMQKTEGSINILSDNEVKILESFSKMHRTAQPFFVTRTETAEAKEEDMGKILDTIEGTDYAELGSEAKEQVVEVNPPVQDQGQAGAPSDVPAQPAPTPTPGGPSWPSVQPDPQV